MGSNMAYCSAEQGGDPVLGLRFSERGFRSGGFSQMTIDPRKRNESSAIATFVASSFAVRKRNGELGRLVLRQVLIRPAELAVIELASNRTSARIFHDPADALSSVDFASRHRIE